MLRAASQQVDGVGEKLDDALERLAGAAWATGQVHDKLIVPCAHNPPRERRQRSFLHPLGAHQFRKTWDLLIEDGAGGFGSDVARSKPRASGGENGVTIIPISPGQKCAPNAVGIVRQDLECLNQPAALFQQLANGRTRTVLPPARGCGITQDEDFGAKRSHEAVSRQLSAISKNFMPCCHVHIPES